MEDNKIFITSDLPLAAYLIIKGLKLVKAKKAVSGRFEFVLEDPKDEAEGLSLMYVNSDFCKFDHTIRSIKKLLYAK